CISIRECKIRIVFSVPPSHPLDLSAVDTENIGSQGFNRPLMMFAICFESSYRSKVTDVQPGKKISTSYGSALVLEKGENGLIKIQPNRGSERWITSDSIQVTYK
ncbi:hypothetical protein GVE98_001416, partial [Neisseria gonorrhoeae]